MKSFVVLALSAVVVTQAQAVSPVGIGPEVIVQPPVVVQPGVVVVPGRRPLFPRRPILVPVQPVPVQPIFPVPAQNPFATLPWNDIDVREFRGPGTSYEQFNIGRSQISYIRVRVPAQCVLKVDGVQATRRGYNIGARLVSSYSELGYNNGVYQVNPGEIDSFRFAVSSNIAYRDFHGCGVRAFTLGAMLPTFPQILPAASGSTFGD